MDIGEMVKAAAPLENWKCPFPHRKQDHDKENYVPPPTKKNDAKKLSSNLDAESEHLEPIPIATGQSGNKNHMAQYTAHHLIPGNESWPTSDLYKWIDKRKGHVKGDIGYDVNDATNGVDLPSNAAAGTWTSRTADFQKRYAFACMEACRKRRQFHDRHPAYSDFVVAVLDKIAAKLDAKPASKKGCGHKNCAAGKRKPYAPPYRVLPRLVTLAARLRNYLWGAPRTWRKPLMTSRFALMYKNQNLTQDEARDQLSTDQFSY